MTENNNSSIKVKPKTFQIHPETKIGNVVLNVKNLKQELEFYKNFLGFKIIPSISDIEKGKIFLSPNGKTPYLIGLVEINKNNHQKRKKARLYHFALLLPARNHLANILKKILKNPEQVTFLGASDHGISEAVYITDPESNGIEIYVDRDKSHWTLNSKELLTLTRPLDIENLSQEQDKSGWQSMPNETRVGHMHLRASDLTKSISFYTEVLGMKSTMAIPNAHFFTFGDYHHHIGLNAWSGNNVLPVDEEADLGLRYFSIYLPNQNEFDKVLKNIQSHHLYVDKRSKSVLISDPNGIKICLMVD